MPSISISAGTDHEVHVYEAVVDSFLLEFLRAHRLAAFEAEGISLADGEMVGGILIKQGVVEDEVRLRDRREMRHQRDFTEAREPSSVSIKPFKVS